MVALVWFRNDLRLTDHLALAAAVETGQPILPLYIDDDISLLRPLGGAAKWWLHHSLSSLSDNFREKGANLILKRGNAFDILKEIVKSVKVSHIFWHRRYDEAGRQLDESIKSYFNKNNVTCESFNGTMLFETEVIKNKQDKPFKVFSPFWKNCVQHNNVNKPFAAPSSIKFNPNLDIQSDDLNAWGFLPTHPNWAKGMDKTWQPGEKGAQKLLDEFIEHKLKYYKFKRNVPALRATSDLSAHIRWGEISMRQLWHTVKQASVLQGCEQSGEKFLSELGWREFAYYTLFHNPKIVSEPLQEKFKNFPWQTNDDFFKAWSKGQTGYPLVDAGMRQLWQTGYMHNRVRMVVGSFLVKHLLQPWQKGEQWFWDTLVDADIASNSFSWQWVAGCGTDAAPYFRIFNPILQSQRFDRDGDYIKRWVPELKTVSAKDIHEPWLLKNKVIGYPDPLINHSIGRERALDIFSNL